MTTTISPPAGSETTPPRLFQAFRFWMALNLLIAGLYLLPLSFPGERTLLLLGLSGFWVGVIMAFWPHRWLRLVPVTVALISFYPVRTGTTRLLLLCGFTIRHRSWARATATERALRERRPRSTGMDYTQVRAGDIVVTESGAHTLAYLGGYNWIEADPLAGAVITLQAPAAKNPWFEQPMKILRWREEE